MVYSLEYWVGMTTKVKYFFILVDILPTTQLHNYWCAAEVHITCCSTVQGEAATEIGRAHVW
jgi:hypothetical protein